jgi:hypothetical protein
MRNIRLSLFRYASKIVVDIWVTQLLPLTRLTNGKLFRRFFGEEQICHRHILGRRLFNDALSSPARTKRLLRRLEGKRCHISFYNIAFVNSERWLAKNRVDITQCQHGNAGKFLSLYFVVLYYKTNIKHFFRIDIQLYQHSWKLGKLEIVWKHSALRASCFHTISRFPNFHSCSYNCISTRKMFYIC